MPMPSHTFVRRILSIVAGGAVVGAALSASAQVRVRRNPILGGLVDPTADAASQDGKDTPVGVTVPDSPGTVERLNHAAEKEQQKQWKTAAEFYREAVTQFAGRVVAGKIDKAAGTYQYTGVATAVQERIAKWPPEGLAIYRNLYGPAAAERLAGATRGDLATLSSVFYDDFVTDAGKAAGLRLIDAYTEAGDFPAAAAIGDRLLDLHPTLGGDRSTVLFRTALADHWGGDDAAANRRLDELRQSDPKAIGSVGGKDAVLVDALAAAIAVPAPAPAFDPLAADTYPSFGGPGGRGDVSPSTAKPGASRTTILLTPPEFGGGNQKSPTDDRLSLSMGGARGIMPVVDAGTLFFQDGRTLYAVDADSGMPVPAWLATYPGQAGGVGGTVGTGGRYRLGGATGRARGEELTVTVTPTAVLAVMGQADRLGAGNAGMFNANVVVMNGEVMNGGSSAVRLVCLDRATGRERWRASPADLPDDAGAAKSAEYGGTPLSIPGAIAGTPDDAVLVAARGGRDGQFDNCYVVCLSARTGQYRWSTYVGSGTRTSDGETIFGQDPTQLSLANGRAFVMTNLGTVAALDPASGRVQWLDAYNRDNTESGPDAFQRLQAGAGQPSKPWERNPIVVQGGHVFALPTDARSLFVLDAATGRQLKRVDTKAYEGASVLLGLHREPRPDGRFVESVILSAEKSIYGIDWSGYDPENPGRAQQFHETTVYGSEPTDVADTTDCTVAGRGFLTASSVLVTTKRNLLQFVWRHGNARLAGAYPETGTFEKTGGQGPGNILVTSQNVVVAGQDRVDVYTDLDLVRAKYAAEMRAAPTDPGPRVRYAMALFAGSKSDEAIARMDEAITLVGGETSMRSGPGRQLIFNVLMDFADRLSKPVATSQTADAATLALAEQLFRRAAAAADGPDQQVSYLLARSRFDHDVAHDYASEIDLCQRVLADAGLRRVLVTDDQTAAAAATSAIASAIAQAPSAYTPIETRATAALNEARAKSDPDALLAVAVLYPNSRAAGEARRTAAGAYEAAGRPAQAIVIRREMYASVTDPVEKGAVLQQIAADFLATGPLGVGPATDRLARAGQLSSNAMLASDLKLPDGTVLRGGEATCADAVTALRGALAKVDEALLPDFHLTPRGSSAPANFSPFAPGGPAIADVTALVHPAPAFTRNDQVLTWSPAGLAAFDVGQSTPRYRLADVTEPPVGAAWIGPRPGGRWVVWSPAQVVAVDDAGAKAWPAVSVRDLPPASAAGAAGGVAVVDDQPGNAPDGEQQQFIQQGVINGQIRVIGGRRMLVRGMQQVDPVQAPAAAPTGVEVIVSAEPAGAAGEVLVASTSTGRLIGIDTAAGRVLWQGKPGDRAVDALQANGHFTVARVDESGASTLVVYDTPTGRVVGRRRFPQENPLVNFALGEEGTLALTLSGTVEVKDLYDPWKEPPRPLVARGNADLTAFTGMNQPNQLLARAGRVVALYNNGLYARAYDLSHPSSEPTNPLSSGPPAQVVSLRLVGPQLFMIQARNVKRFNLADLNDVSSGMLPSNDYRVRGMLLGSDFAILVHDPVDRGPAGSPNVWWLAVSRAPVPGRHLERDSMDSIVESRFSTGITDWIGTDGGICFLTGDQHLRFRRGGRP